MRNFVLSSIVVLGLAGAVYVVTPVSAEVNIAEVEGKYRDKTIKDALEQRQVMSIQLMNMALKQAYLAGYGQAMIDYDVICATSPAKIITKEEQESDER